MTKLTIAASDIEELTIEERITISKAEMNASSEAQLEVVNLVRHFVISGIDECVTYYEKKGYSIGINPLQALNDAKSGLEAYVANDMYEMQAGLYELSIYHFPYECRDILPYAQELLKGYEVDFMLGGSSWQSERGANYHAAIDAHCNITCLIFPNMEM